MRDLFTAMMKEEWRVHSTMFGAPPSPSSGAHRRHRAHGLGPPPLHGRDDPGGMIGFTVHAMFFLMGAMVGGFGLLGKEVMNRRFGQASLLAYSSRTLPCQTGGSSRPSSQRTRSIICSSGWSRSWPALPWARPLRAPLSFVGIAAVSLTLTFLLGLSTIFFLSTLYAHSLKLVAAALSAGLILALLLTAAGMNPMFLFPTYALFREWSAALFLFSVGSILIFSAVSIQYMTTEFPDHEKRYADGFSPLAARIRRFRYAPLVAKDILDLRRSGGLVGQTIFSFLFPLGIIWVTLSVLGRILPSARSSSPSLGRRDHRSDACTPGSPSSIPSAPTPSCPGHR